MLEMDIALLKNDLDWLKRLQGWSDQNRHREEIRQKWGSRLSHWSQYSIDDDEKEMINAALRELELA